MLGLPAESGFFMATLTPAQAEQMAHELRDYMIEVGQKRCLCCVASMSKSTHHLTKVMVDALVKICRSVALSKLNDVRVDKLNGPLALTHIERCNFHKLRMHGLVAKVKVDGRIKGGRWLVTHRGWQFIQGSLSVPKTVYSFRNHVISKEAEMLTVKDVIGEEPYCETVDDQLFIPLTDEDIEKLDVASYKNKRRKNPCPQCQKGQLKKRMRAEIVNGMAQPEFWVECDHCKYKIVD